MVATGPPLQPERRSPKSPEEDSEQDSEENGVPAPGKAPRRTPRRMEFRRRARRNSTLLGVLLVEKIQRRGDRPAWRDPMALLTTTPLPRQDVGLHPPADCLRETVIDYGTNMESFRDSMDEWENLEDF